MPSSPGPKAASSKKARALVAVRHASLHTLVIAAHVQAPGGDPAQHQVPEEAARLVGAEEPADRADGAEAAEDLAELLLPLGLLDEAGRQTLQGRDARVAAVLALALLQGAGVVLVHHVHEERNEGQERENSLAPWHPSCLGGLAGFLLLGFAQLLALATRLLALAAGLLGLILFAALALLDALIDSHRRTRLLLTTMEAESGRTKKNL